MIKRQWVRRYRDELPPSAERLMTESRRCTLRGASPAAAGTSEPLAGPVASASLVTSGTSEPLAGPEPSGSAVSSARSATADAPGSGRCQVSAVNDAIGALFAVYGVGILFISLFRRQQGNRQFFQEMGEDGLLLLTQKSTNKMLQYHQTHRSLSHRFI